MELKHIILKITHSLHFLLFGISTPTKKKKKVKKKKKKKSFLPAYPIFFSGCNLNQLPHIFFLFGLITWRIWFI